MTFEEAFNSGKKFRLPEDYGMPGAWPKGWYWQKIIDGQIKGSFAGIYSVNRILNESMFEDLEYKLQLVIYRLSDDWEIYED